MSKIIHFQFDHGNKNEVGNGILPTLNHPAGSFLFITCSSPSKNGDMEVNLECQGDPDLISYLLERAQDHFSS